MNTLPVIKKKSFFEEIKKSIKRLFRIKTEENKQQEEKLNREFVSESNFRNNIRIEEDLSKKKLLEIQIKLEEGGITEELISVLTKDLTNAERVALLELYEMQIKELEESLKNYKSKILAIRNKVNA